MSLFLFVCYHPLGSGEISGSRKVSTTLVRCTDGALATYQHSAAFFTFTILMVTAAFHVRTDYSAKKISLSAGSLEMSQTVSLLTFIPLLYPLAIRAKRSDYSGRPQLYLLFIFLCALPLVYITFSRLIKMCSPPLKNLPLTNPVQWEQLTAACYSPSTLVPAYERKVSAILMLVESFIVLALALYEVSTMCLSRRRCIPLQKGKKDLLRGSLYLGLLPLFACSQAVALMRLWNEQKWMARHANYEFAADTWGFGQIAAVMVWAPVLIEPVCMWTDKKPRGAPS